MFKMNFKTWSMFIVYLLLISTLVYVQVAEAQYNFANLPKKFSFKYQTDKVLSLFSNYSQILPRTVKDALELSKGITENSFRQYMKIFNKVYLDNSTQFSKHFKSFKDNAKQVFLSKYNYLVGKSSYSLGFNQFSDWTVEDIHNYVGLPSKPVKMISLSTNPPISERNHSFVRAIWALEGELNSFLYPGVFKNSSSFDWRKSGCIVEPENQGMCGSCTTFAMMAMLEARRCIVNKTEPAIKLSKQHILDCALKVSGCRGAAPSNIAEFIKQENEVIREECYPYTQSKGSCFGDGYKGKYQEASCKLNATTHQNEVYFYNYNNEQEMIEGLKHSPLVVGVYSSSYAFRFYEKGIISQSYKDISYRPDHAVLIIGYGEERGVKYWIVKNSWGTDWGEGGYFRIERGKNAFNIESYHQKLGIKY